MTNGLPTKPPPSYLSYWSYCAKYAGQSRVRQRAASNRMPPTQKTRRGEARRVGMIYGFTPNS